MRRSNIRSCTSGTRNCQFKNTPPWRCSRVRAFADFCCARAARFSLVTNCFLVRGFPINEAPSGTRAIALSESSCNWNLSSLTKLQRGTTIANAPNSQRKEKIKTFLHPSLEPPQACCKLLLLLWQRKERRFWGCDPIRPHRCKIFCWMHPIQDTRSQGRYYTAYWKGNRNLMGHLKISPKSPICGPQTNTKNNCENVWPPIFSSPKNIADICDMLTSKRDQECIIMNGYRRCPLYFDQQKKIPHLTHFDLLIYREI